jgi:hypothetical protein
MGRMDLERHISGEMTFVLLKFLVGMAQVVLWTNFGKCFLYFHNSL